MDEIRTLDPDTVAHSFFFFFFCAHVFSFSLVCFVPKHSSVVFRASIAIEPFVFEKTTSERVQRFSIVSIFFSDFHTTILFSFAFIADRCPSTCLVDCAIHHFAQVMTQQSSNRISGRSFGRRLRWWAFRCKSTCPRQCSHTSSSNTTSTNYAMCPSSCGCNPLQDSKPMPKTWLVKSELAGSGKGLEWLAFCGVVFVVASTRTVRSCRWTIWGSSSATTASCSWKCEHYGESGNDSAFSNVGKQFWSDVQNSTKQAVAASIYRSGRLVAAVPIR